MPGLLSDFGLTVFYRGSLIFSWAVPGWDVHFTRVILVEVLHSLWAFFLYVHFLFCDLVFTWVHSCCYIWYGWSSG
jgi:hypothetical protein